MGDLQGVAHVVVGDQDADPGVGQALDDALDLVDGDRVDAGERFVQEQELGLRGQGAGDLGTAPLAAGEV